MADEIEIGSIGWVDMTSDEAPRLRDFYQHVVGWEPQGVSMGDYEDYNMLEPGSGTAAAGICHARGVNAAFPPQWLVYITVADIKKSAAICREQGGSVLVEPGDSGICVIKDPSGAVAALYQPG